MLAFIMANSEKMRVWNNIIDYEPINGNAIWRLLLVLVVVLAAMLAGRIAQYIIGGFVSRRERSRGVTLLTLLLKCLSKPISVVIFAIGLHLCRLCLVFQDNAAMPPIEGISEAVAIGWARLATAVFAISVAYAFYKLVDIVEYYLLRWTGETETKLDDMLVPVVRKSLRVTITIIAVIFIIDNILQQDVQSILLSAGVGGIAIALAAKDTVANFFGSITIFADRPFQIDDLVRIEGHYGPVEEVGFRSTRIRTLEGHLVTVPNSIITNSVVENIGKRPFIRRTSNITITYGSGHTKARKAVEIITEILAGIPEVNAVEGKSPRVFFNEFNDWSLNIYMSYWVKPPDYWLYQQVNERVNLEMMKRFEAEGIEFAFPTQTLHIEKG